MRAIRGAATYPPGVRVVDKGGAAGKEAVEEKAKGKGRLLVAHNQATRRVAETVENLRRLPNEEGEGWGGGRGKGGSVSGLIGGCRHSATARFAWQNTIRPHHAGHATQDMPCGRRCRP